VQSAFPRPGSAAHAHDWQGPHTDVAFVCKVGQAGVTDLTVLGDGANVAARLSSLAQAGEVLISGATFASAGLTGEGLESRILELKGRSEPMEVWVRRVVHVPAPV
jgi:class 3 adenylate cyclase